MLANPEDPALGLSLRRLLSRIADLGDWVAWGRAHPHAQDQVLEVLAQLLPEFAYLGAEAYAVGEVAHRVGRFRHEPSQLELHLIPGGSATLGPGRDGWNRETERRVQLQPLLVGRFPVRQLEWDRRPHADERSFVGAELPIEGVTWHAARAWLSEVSLRLPSEAEWEFACRAGSTTEYFWGGEPNPAYAWRRSCSGVE